MGKRKYPQPWVRPGDLPGSCGTLGAMTDLNRRQALGALGTVSLASLLPRVVRTASRVRRPGRPQRRHGFDRDNAEDDLGLEAGGRRLRVRSDVPRRNRVDRGPVLLRRRQHPRRLARGPRGDAAAPRRARARRGDLRAAGERDRPRLALRRPRQLPGFEVASNGAGGGMGRTDDETYLRGAQATNSDGIVEFKTIYPGWYRGRTTHIHAKAHFDKATLLTTQLYTTTEFDEKVHAAEPDSEDTRPRHLQRLRRDLLRRRRAHALDGRRRGRRPDHARRRAPVVRPAAPRTPPRTSPSRASTDARSAAGGRRSP